MKLNCLSNRKPTLLHRLSKRWLIVWWANVCRRFGKVVLVACVLVEEWQRIWSFDRSYNTRVMPWVVRVDFAHHGNCAPTMRRWSVGLGERIDRGDFDDLTLDVQPGLIRRAKQNNGIDSGTGAKPSGRASTGQSTNHFSVNAPYGLRRYAIIKFASRINPPYLPSKTSSKIHISDPLTLQLSPDLYWDVPALSKSRMFASAGVRPPLRLLQPKHEQTTFSHVVLPPCDRGVT